MKRVLIFTALLLVIFSSQGFAVVYNVTNCSSDASTINSLPYHISLGHSPIRFNITTAEAGYSTGEAYPGLVTNEATGKSWFRIILNSTLSISSSIWIQGSTQPITESNNPSGPEVEVRMIGSTADIFYLSGSGITIEGLAINRIGGPSGAKAISLAGSNCCILGCYIGVSATGEAASPTKNDYGISLYGSASNNKIGDGTVGGKNVISGNTSSGIYIYGSAACSNEVLGNYIGTDATGTAALPNSRGVYLDNYASYNRIGDGTSGGRNIISGNNDGYNGSGIYFNSVSSNEVSGNYIGTDVSGTVGLAHIGDGITIMDSSNNVIGGASTLEANVISANGYNGITLMSGNTAYNQIKGNLIGTTASGEAALGNGTNGYFDGIYIANNAHDNTIGGDTTFEGNVISGNTNAGVTIADDSYGNVLKNNIIGLSQSQTSKIPNNQGIKLNFAGSNNQIGASGFRGNTISGNSNYGIINYSTNGTKIIQNAIGSTFPNFPSDLGNGDSGIYLGDSTGVIIGGDNGSKEGNVISGNSGNGIEINSGSHNRIRGNYIGLQANGETALYNDQNGIRITGAGPSNYNVIGGSGVGEGNVIVSKASYNGIYILSSNSRSNEVAGNYIGTNKTGTNALGAVGSTGIRVEGASNNVIGSTDATGRNIISGNGDGIWLYNNAQNNAVIGNYIGTTSSGEAALPNSVGITLYYGSTTGNKIGNGKAGGRNVISGNSTMAIDVEQCGSNEILGNYIGISASGSKALPNNVTGSNYGCIRLTSAATFNRIGNGTALGRNVISGNGHEGIRIEGSTTLNNEVIGNYIGTDPTGTSAMQNGTNGIYILSGSSYNRIGGTQAGYGNVISGNSFTGINLNTAYDNDILSNCVGLDANGNTAVPNGSYGIYFQGASNNNNIGNGSTAGRNIVSGNTYYGIFFNGSGVNNNQILGNYVGTDASGTLDRGNGNFGIYLSQSPFNKIGDGTINGRNVISGNDRYGISFNGSDCMSNEVLGNCIGTDASGTINLGNTWHGIYIQDAPMNRIGPSNIIAYNGNASFPAGVRIEDIPATSETITQNSIFANYNKGISLISGANRGIAIPEIASTSYSQPTGLLQITGAATPNATVEIFKAQGNQGKIYLGSVTANGSGAVNGSLTYLGLVSGDVLVATQTDPLNDTSEFSNTKEVVVTTALMYQPDLMIGTLESGADYIGEGIFENTPVTQVKTDSVATNETAVCYLKIKNAGNMLDTLIITGEGDSTGFTVKYFDSKTGTNELTSIATGPGYNIALPPAVSVEGRVEVAYSGTVTATKELIITTTSSSDSSKIDAIKAIAVFTPYIPPAPPTPTQPATKEYTSTDLGIPGMSITVPSGATTFDATITATEVPAPGAAPVGYLIGG